MIAKNTDEVIAYLDQIIAESKVQQSRVGFFAALYRQVSLKIKQGIDQGLFDDNDRMNRFSAAFANRYFDALVGDRNGGKITKSWKIAFQTVPQSDVIILQHLLLAINAHINLDLGIVVAQLCPGEKLVTFTNDFQTVNKLLIEILDNIQGAVNEFSPLFDILDRVGGRNEEEVIKFSITKARAHAWNVAENLAFLSAEQQANQIINWDEKIAFLGQVIISPSRIIDKALDLIQAEESKDVSKIIDALNS